MNHTSLEVKIIIESMPKGLDGVELEPRRFSAPS